MTNGYGSARYDREKDFAAYDRSPPLLRQAQAYAVAKWCARGILKHYVQQTTEGVSPDVACLTIMRGLAKAERRDTAKAYGKTHPEAFVARSRA